jgi:hypothetical protein
MKSWEKTSKVVLIIGAIVALGFLAYFLSPFSQLSPLFSVANTISYDTAYVATTTLLHTPKFVVTHETTPVPLKAIYMSSWVAGSPKLRDNLVKLIDDTEINAVVIDIKDYTGRIAFEVENPKLKEYGSVEKRISDIKEFIDTLHKKHVYVIGRISSFQDSFLVDKHPEYAVKTKEGTIWKDFKGVRWLDAGAKPVWDYLALIGNEAYADGFDELNFDYIRFPSDGNMKDIAYPYSEGKVKADVLKEFYAFLGDEFHPKKIPISGDLFGLTTSDVGDLGIGQVLENALAHFDYVAPMVYPSHYAAGFNGWKNPASVPYDLIHYAMSEGIKKAEAASTTPEKLRPWLQDFSIGHTDYTPEMVRAQITATNDVGLTSWMMWNAANHYTASALLPALTSEK